MLLSGGFSVSVGRDLKLNDGWILTEDGFIVHLIKAEVYKVNKTGLEILELLQEGRDKDEICKIISQKYFIDVDLVKTDFEKFMVLLEKLGIVELMEDE